jgi:hypothetical protein
VAANEMQVCKTSTGIGGVCYFGLCNTQIQLPTTPPPICKMYRCTPGAPCSLVNQADGTDCTTPGAAFHSVCMTGVCKLVVDGLNKAGQNTGCWLVKDNTLCDTNGIFTDGEICINNVCTRPPPLRPLKPAVAMPRGNCPITNIGLECTTLTTTVNPVNFLFHYFCIANPTNTAGTCQPFVDALTRTAPVYNNGCLVYKDGTRCDTNADLFDGETCISGICKFPDGSYNGNLQA